MKVEREHVALVLVSAFVICSFLNFAWTWETCNQLDMLESSAKGLTSRASVLLRKLALELKTSQPVDESVVANGLSNLRLKSLTVHRDHILTQLYFISTQLGMALPSEAPV